MLKRLMLKKVALIVLCGGACYSSAATHEHDDPVVLAPGYADLSFSAPVPGTYQLPPLGAAADGPVLTSSNKRLMLHDLLGDRIVLLSFIYTTCGDVNGCPLATHVLAKVQRALLAAPELRDKVRILSVSFDPDHDTPRVMRTYGDRFLEPGVDWRFLTSASRAELDPLLERYDQWVIRDYDETGAAVGSMSHVLRVYLIDGSRRIRNIYSVSFLHADTILVDVRTLLGESSG